MNIQLFTDPHLGLLRSDNVTMAGAARYREALYQAALSASCKEFTGADEVQCLGDLFDRTSNSEETLLQGHKVTQRCSLVLAGNHDIPNRVGIVSSLSLISEVIAGLEDDSGDGPTVCMSPDPGKPYFMELCSHSGSLIYVPHCLTQEVFATSLNQAQDHVIRVSSRGPNVLMLHCNVGNGFGEIEGDGSSLWLTSELQSQLLETFDLILVGHEHEPRELHGGRLVILGNTFPVAFGEMADRFVYNLKIVDGKPKLTKKKSFDVSKSFIEVPVEDLSAVTSDHLFVRITGKIKPENFPEFTRRLGKLWKENPNLLAVQKAIEVERAGRAAVEVAEGWVRKSLPELVSEAVGPAGFQAEYEQCTH